MREYLIELDVTMSVRIYVDANNEEQAKELALSKIETDTLYHIRTGCYVDSQVTDIIEQDKAAE